MDEWGMQGPRLLGINSTEPVRRNRRWWGGETGTPGSALLLLTASDILGSHYTLEPLPLQPQAHLEYTPTTTQGEKWAWALWYLILILSLVDIRITMDTSLWGLTGGSL